jgi:leucyl-tRNA synthetase
LFAPYAAEDGWALLGHDVEGGDLVGRATWPVADPRLLVEDTVTCVIQVAGKVRARLAVPPGVDEGTLRDLALADEAVRRALGDREIRTVIVRPPRLVNVVPA